MTVVSAKDSKDECLTIAEIACGTDGFETLCTAVVAAELDGALSDGSKYTVVFIVHSFFIIC
jgi:hypothetical protein